MEQRKFDEQMMNIPNSNSLSQSMKLIYYLLKLKCRSSQSLVKKFHQWIAKNFVALKKVDFLAILLTLSALWLNEFSVNYIKSGNSFV